MKKLTTLEKVLYILPVIIFLILCILVKTNLLIDLDKGITLSIYNEFNNPNSTFLFQLITNYTLGSIFGIILVVLFLIYKKQFVSLTFFLSTGLLLFLIEHIIKNIFHRVRPFLSITDVISFSTKNLTDYSFPSGHSMLSFFIAFFIVNKYKPNIYVKVAIYWVAFMVAFSRIVLGVHYFFDVVAGACLGTIIGYLAVYLSNKFDYKNTQLLNNLSKKNV